MDVANWVSLAICIESCLFISILYGIDTYRRVSKEMRREKWKDQVPVWPRTVWWFLTTTYSLFIVTIILSFLLSINEYIHYIFTALLTLSIQPDWYEMERQSQYIRQAYDRLNQRSMCRKYWTIIIASTASIITICIYIIYCINPNAFNISLSLFIIIQFSISLFVMLFIGSNFYFHARIGHLNSVTTLRAGKKSYYAYLERFWYYCFYFWIRIISHIIFITIFALNIALGIDAINDIHCIIFGSVFQFWFFGYYYLFVSNRWKLHNYKYCKCCTNIWDNWAHDVYTTSRALVLERQPSEIGAI